MRKIVKDDTPEFWKRYILHNKKIYYDSADKKQKLDLRKHMLKVQGYICAYCCACIDERNSHNEHIKPKAGHRYPNLSMDYKNLLVSCTTKGSKRTSTCGMHKGDEYDEQFVSPLESDCAEHFCFEVDGRVKGITPRGVYTVELLNLNAYKLVNSRKALIDEMNICRDYGKEFVQQNYIDEHDGRLPRFVDMTEYLLKQGYFDGNI